MLPNLLTTADRTWPEGWGPLSYCFYRSCLIWKERHIVGSINQAVLVGRALWNIIPHEIRLDPITLAFPKALKSVPKVLCPRPFCYFGKPHYRLLDMAVIPILVLPRKFSSSWEKPFGP